MLGGRTCLVGNRVERHPLGVLTDFRCMRTKASKPILEHDVVALAAQIGTWPAGTTGTVESLYEDAALVEVAEDDPPGSALDNLLPIPVEQLELRWSHRTGRVRNMEVSLMEASDPASGS